MDTYYRANRKLRIPNGPGNIPSSTRVEAGEIFSLDGTEPIDVPLLLRLGAISPTERPVVEVPTGTIPRRKPAIRRAK